MWNLKIKLPATGLEPIGKRSKCSGSRLGKDSIWFSSYYHINSNLFSNLPGYNFFRIMIMLIFTKNNELSTGPNRCFTHRISSTTSPNFIPIL